MKRKKPVLIEPRPSIAPWPPVPLPEDRTAPLPTALLRRRVDPAALGFETTVNLHRLESIIEQPRPFEALRLGGTVKSRNYNIYVAGRPGTGKLTAVRKVLAEIAAAQEAPGDICYVFNFKNPYEPKALFFPRGRGAAFQKEFEALIEQSTTKLPQVYLSREYQLLLQGVVNTSMEQENDAFLKLSEMAKGVGFAVKSTKDGLVTIPIFNNRPLSDKDYDQLPAEVKRKIEDQRRKLTPFVQEFLQHSREIQTSTQKGVLFLQQQLVEQMVKPEIERLKQEYGTSEKISAWLDSVLADMLEHPQKLLPHEGEEDGEAAAAIQARPELKEYRVNLVVDNSETQGAPIIYEKNPTYPNLVGKIDKVMEQGAFVTDFTMIRPGSILKANGGYLLINAFDLLTKPYGWQALKAALRDREVAIEDFGEQYGFPPSVGLKPEPTPVDFKVVLMGNNHIYHLLYEHDEDFQKLFQIKSEFDFETAASEDELGLISRFVSTICDKEKLEPVHATGMAALIEYGMRQVEHQKKISLCFADLANLVVESSFYAAKEGAKVIGVEHVEEAITRRQERLSLSSDKILELYEQGTLFVDVDGTRAGQVNGLAVFQLSGFSFGKPLRFTAATFAGRGGVVNIEREAKMAGPLFNKATLIISGYLRNRFAREKALSLNISLAVEQSYGGIEGDSASIAEVYAVLSAIAGAKVFQGVAVTGSMNQMGDVQPIGGVNEKIEGFFEVCKLRGLTGRQGVIIPRANVQNLMLRREVVEAVEQGRFHVWGIDRVEQGVPLLFGLEAGQAGPEGKYPEGTLFAACASAIAALAPRKPAKVARDRRAGDEDVAPDADEE